MTTWLVTGAGGMLGTDLVARLEAAGETAIGVDRSTLDITDPVAVRATFAEHRPTVVVNCAAWTAVDDAETREPEALRINGDGAALLAQACADHGRTMLQISTNYVFDGDAEKPYDEDAPTGPRTAYGRTKLAGDEAVLAALPDAGYVVRTAWLYGANGQNFVRTMIALEASKPTIDVVDDQRGQPTWTVDLADCLIRLGRAAVAGSAAPGIYHGVSGGEATWYDLARATFRALNADPDRVRPTSSETFVRPAARPANGVLGRRRWDEAGIEPIRDWRAGLAQAFASVRAGA
jgi:dTDP-4-dehydrorhamnose reductase